MDETRCRYPAQYLIPTGYMRFALLRHSDGSTGLGFLQSDTFHEPAYKIGKDEWHEEKHQPVFELICDSPEQVRVIIHVLSSIAARLEGKDPHEAIKRMVEEKDGKQNE